MTDGAHPLLAVLVAAADGVFPPVDGGCTVLPSLGGGLECSVALTGHAYVATSLPAGEVLARGPDGFGGSVSADFLRWLAGPTGTIGVLDVTLVARGTGAADRPGAAGGAGPGRVPLAERRDADGHPRVRHARDLRREVRVHGDERGLVTLGRGLAGRCELSIEADAGHGRSLLHDALDLVRTDEYVFAAVSPGNARSLRLFLGAGFRPLGSEVILRPARYLSGQAPANLAAWTRSAG
jgi:hypothetical protein